MTESEYNPERLTGNVPDKKRLKRFLPFLTLKVMFVRKNKYVINVKNNGDQSLNSQYICVFIYNWITIWTDCCNSIGLPFSKIHSMWAFYRGTLKANKLYIVLFIGQYARLEWLKSLQQIPRVISISVNSKILNLNI